MFLDLVGATLNDQVDTGKTPVSLFAEGTGSARYDTVTEPSSASKYVVPVGKRLTVTGAVIYNGGAGDGTYVGESTAAATDTASAPAGWRKKSVKLANPSAGSGKALPLGPLTFAAGTYPTCLFSVAGSIQLFGYLESV